MDITFLQWNIWYDEDIQKVASFLLDNKADIICLQELSYNNPEQAHPDGPPYIAEQLGYTYYVKKLHPYEVQGQTVTTANGIFSKYPIKSCRFIWVNEPTGVGGFADEYRAYLEVVLDIEGKEVTVGTVHMSYTDRFQVTERKHQETDKLVAELKKQKSNFIFSGDLNVTPDSYTVKSINELLNNAGPPINEKTWTTKPFSYNGFEETKRKWRLDYIFTSKDVRVLKAKIEETSASDHLPISATVRFSK